VPVAVNHKSWVSHMHAGKSHDILSLPRELAINPVKKVTKSQVQTQIDKG
jgi:hypothetical protein